MNPIENILKEYPIIILDGALATQLEKRGCDLNDSLWSAKILAKDPGLIEDVHYEYFMSGADCAITASYQATIDGFIKKGFTEAEAINLIKSSVEIAIKARERFWSNSSNRLDRPKPFIAGSIGPYGAYLADGSEYSGDYKIGEEELSDFHRPRIRLLLEAGIDILACETIPSLTEARVIVKLLEEFPETYAWISFSCKNEHEISDGTPISKCAEFLQNYKQVAALGINCTPPKYINSLIDEIKKVSDKRIVVYPNSGEDYNLSNKSWHGHYSSETFGLEAEGWFKKGAKLIGGCCRTGPEEIKITSHSLRRKT